MFTGEVGRHTCPPFWFAFVTVWGLWFDIFQEGSGAKTCTTCFVGTCHLFGTFVVGLIFCRRGRAPNLHTWLGRFWSFGGVYWFDGLVLV